VEGAPFVAEALKRGLVINCTHDFTLRFLPPFIVGERQVREFLQKLETVFNETQAAAKHTAKPQAQKASLKKLAS
jgi:acetylornithine/succinyldiaminopimelate/putrescine aminotransferase